MRFPVVARAFGALLLLLLLLLFALPAPAAVIWAQGGALVACYPGNQEDLSSAGCPCASNNECRTTCSLQTGTCASVTGAAVCASGNTINASVNGCACSNDNECVGNCNQTTHTCGGVTNAPVCSIGNGVKASTNGCPCASSNECQGSCVASTDTCGGVVGAVDDNQPAIAGTAASAVIALGTAMTDTATLSSGILAPDGSIGFELYGPSQATCIGAPVFTASANVAGNGNYVSAAFMPIQPGYYRWVARYSGDAYNLTAATTCSDASQRVLVQVLDRIFFNGFELPPPQ
ncbi:hypothetical protein [Tahibacter aquaticus]|nr:hypothetical protein [Tahibacter aquaticus]